MIRRLLRRLAEWVTDDPPPKTQPARKPAPPPTDEPDWGDPWDPDDLPSTADPGVVADPKEE